MSRFVLLLCATALSGSAHAQIMRADAQPSIAQHCLALAADPPAYDSFNDAAYRRAVSAWAKACGPAEPLAKTDPKIAAAVGAALDADGQRERAIPFYRLAGLAGDAASLLRIFEHHRSWDRGDLAKPQIVSRAEADAALRRAAELGNGDATVALAVRLERGEIVKRDRAAARVWFGKMRENPPKNWTIADIETRIANLLVASEKTDERLEGMRILLALAQRGYAPAKVGLAVRTRGVDPARSRELLVAALRGDPGGAGPPLADMMVKGEGGAADPQRALAILHECGDVPACRIMLGRFYLEGKGVPQDIQRGVDLVWSGSAFDLDARIEATRLVARFPQVRVDRPERLLYDATVNAELDEPGARDALVQLKLSDNPQFRDIAGGCRLAADYEIASSARCR